MRSSKLAIASMMGLIAASALSDAQKIAGAGTGQRGLRRDAKYVHTGGTFNKGRNARKREIKALRKKGRAIQVRMAAGKKAAKCAPLFYLRFA